MVKFNLNTVDQANMDDDYCNNLDKSMDNDSPCHDYSYPCEAIYLASGKNSKSLTLGDIVFQFIPNCHQLSYEKIINPDKKIKTKHGVKINESLYKQNEDDITLFLVNNKRKRPIGWIKDPLYKGKGSKYIKVEGSETPAFSKLKTVSYKLFGSDDQEVKPKKKVKAPVTGKPKHTLRQPDEKHYCDICKSLSVPSEEKVKKKGHKQSKLTKHQKMEAMYKMWCERMRKLVNFNSEYDCQNVASTGKWANLVLGDYISVDDNGNIVKTSHKPPHPYVKYKPDPKDPFFKKGLLEILKTPLYHNCFEEFLATMEDEMEKRDENYKKIEQRKEVIAINRPKPKVKEVPQSDAEFIAELDRQIELQDEQGPSKRDDSSEICAKKQEEEEDEEGGEVEEVEEEEEKEEEDEESESVEELYYNLMFDEDDQKKYQKIIEESEGSIDDVSYKTLDNYYPFKSDSCISVKTVEKEDESQYKDDDYDEYRDLTDTKEPRFICDFSILDKKPKGIARKKPCKTETHKGVREEIVREGDFIGMPEHMDLSDYRDFSDYFNVKLRIFENSRESVHEQGINVKPEEKKVEAKVEDEEKDDSSDDEWIFKHL